MPTLGLEMPFVIAESIIRRSPFVITGDTGFVGSRLRKLLLARGESVLGIHRHGDAANLGENYFALPMDLSDATVVRRHADVFRAAQAVIHLAGCIPQSDDEPLSLHVNANLRTTENVIHVLDGSAVPFVLMSTMYVYGLPVDALPVAEGQVPRPVSAYGISKFAAEYATAQMAIASRIRAVVLRCPGIFGVGSDVALQLYASRALAGEAVSVYGGGNIVRDYVFVDDVVNACLLAAEKAADVGWRIYHIGSGETATLLDLAQLTVDSVGAGTVTTNDRPGPDDFTFDIARARAELGYAPQTLKQRIAEYVGELRANGI